MPIENGGRPIAHRQNDYAVGVRRAVVYAVCAIACIAGALLAYPFFFTQNYRGFEDNPATIVVFVSGSLGKSNPEVDVSAKRSDANALLTVSQVDVTQPVQQDATIYVGIEHQSKGFAFTYTPLVCSAGNSKFTTKAVSPDDLWRTAVSQGKATAVPKVAGTLTAITFDQSVVAPTVTCPLKAFGFGQESIATRNVFLPGVESYALDGSQDVVTTYTIGREASEYVQQASQNPSEVLATEYTWYQRDFELLARQGLFVEITSPQAQQESTYRLFFAGALLGLAGGLVVAALQAAVEKRP